MEKSLTDRKTKRAGAKAKCNAKTANKSGTAANHGVGDGHHVQVAAAEKSAPKFKEPVSKKKPYASSADLVALYKELHVSDADRNTAHSQRSAQDDSAAKPSKKNKDNAIKAVVAAADVEAPSGSKLAVVSLSQKTSAESSADLVSLATSGVGTQRQTARSQRGERRITAGATIAGRKALKSRAATARSIANMLAADEDAEDAQLSPCKAVSLPNRKANASRADPISLSIGSNVLRMSDIALLHGPRCFNEALINFYYAYLSDVKFAGNKDLLFVTPAMTQCILYMDEIELQELLVRQCKAVNCQFIFFALSATKDGRTQDGHFSLMLASRPDKIVYHADFCGGRHDKSTRELFSTIKDMLQLGDARFQTISASMQQNNNNTYDCGVHIICMTDLIADYVYRFETMEGLPTLPVHAISGKRSQIIKLINNFGGLT